MGFYNMLFGTNRASKAVLSLLNLTLDDVGRFRNLWIEEGRIAVYTRNGGGNREHWDDDIAEGPECRCYACAIQYRLPKHPNYLFDRDDSFDSTYATIYFSFPDEHKELLEKMAGPEINMSDEWLGMIAALKKGADET